MSPRRLAVDTSIAVPYLIANHDAHSAVVAEFDSDELLLAGHARFETYAVITRLPAALRSSAAQAMLAIGS